MHHEFCNEWALIKISSVGVSKNIIKIRNFYFKIGWDLWCFWMILEWAKHLHISAMSFWGFLQKHRTLSLTGDPKICLPMKRVALPLRSVHLTSHCQGGKNQQFINTGLIRGCDKWPWISVDIRRPKRIRFSNPKRLAFASPVLLANCHENTSNAKIMPAHSYANSSAPWWVLESKLQYPLSCCLSAMICALSAGGSWSICCCGMAITCFNSSSWFGCCGCGGGCWIDCGGCW